jgi:hypothetical protein
MPKQTTSQQIGFDDSPNLQINTLPSTNSSAPKVVEPEKKEWTDEELEDLKNATMKGLGWGDEPEPEKKTEEPTAPEPELEAEKSKPEDSKPEKSPAKKPTSSEKIAEAIEKANEKLLDRLSTRAPASNDDHEVETSPQQTIDSPTEKEQEDEHLRRVFSTMAKLNPKKSSNLPEEFEKFLKVEKDYRDQWEADNKGKTFDPGADEHEDWYQDNQPDYDEAEYHRAQGRVESENVWKERETQKIRESAMQSAKEVAEVVADDVTDAIEGQISAQLTEILGDNTLLKDEGPIQDKFNQEIGHLREKIEVATYLMTQGTSLKYDPNNKLHTEAHADVLAFDEDISKLSAEEQHKLVETTLGKRNKLSGKSFVKMDDFVRLTPGQQQESWTIGMQPVIAAKLMAEVSKESMGGWIGKLFKQVSSKSGSGSVSNAGHSGNSEKPESSSVSSGKPTPPNISPSASNVTSQPGESVKGGNSWEDIAMRF